MKYKVEVVFHATETVEVQADNPEDARRIVDNMVVDRDLLAEDLAETNWTVGDAKCCPTCRGRGFIGYRFPAHPCPDCKKK